jgi:hypothetical protein
LLEESTLAVAVQFTDTSLSHPIKLDPRSDRSAIDPSETASSLWNIEPATRG